MYNQRRRPGSTILIRFRTSFDDQDDQGINIDRHSTIENVRRTLGQYFYLRMDEIWLYWSDTLLEEDQRTVQSYGIGNDELIIIEDLPGRRMRGD